MNSLEEVQKIYARLGILVDQCEEARISNKDVSSIEAEIYELRHMLQSLLNRDCLELKQKT